MKIEVKDLTYKYSAGLPYETLALSGVSFLLEDGSFTTVIGHTGSGKSTLAELLCGLKKPLTGDILLDGASICASSSEARKLRRSVGMVFQYPEYQLFEESVIKDVCFGPKNSGLDEAAAKEAAMKALSLVGMTPEKLGKDILEGSPFTLSGGEKRRVAIAGVLAMQPKVLILDEPSAGLDPSGRREILSMISGLKKQQNLTIILISHDMDAAAELSDNILVMNEGRSVLFGSPQKVFAESDMLRSIGLDLPAPAAFCEDLKSRGMDLPDGIITMEEAAQCLSRILL